MKILIIIIALVFTGCDAPKLLTESDSSEPLHIIITIMHKDDALNKVLAVFNGVKKPDNMKVYFLSTPNNSVTVDCYWKEIDPQNTARLKEYCNKLPEKITVEFSKEEN